MALPSVTVYSIIVTQSNRFHKDKRDFIDILL